MTTIAVDKYSIACDRQFSHSGGHIFRGRTKIYELPPVTCEQFFDCKKAAVGFAGNADQIVTALEFLFDPMEGACPKVKGLELVALTDNYDIWTSFTLRNWMLVDQSYYAIGSGTQFALGALASGKSPLEAVKIAAKNDSNTGMGFREIKVNEAK